MDALVSEDTQRYRQALEAAGDIFGGIEPVQRFHEAFQSPLDAATCCSICRVRNRNISCKRFVRTYELTDLRVAGVRKWHDKTGHVDRDQFREIDFCIGYL